jgi:glycosyl hydrolase family 43
MNPTQCEYAPPGEYMKDHSFVRKDGWWHLFNISGTAGYYHGYNGNEETVAWSVSRDLVDWEFRGHVLHASQWDGFFDQHEVWAPFCFRGDEAFYLFYTGIVHPTRPLEYRKLGHGHPWVHEGHGETQGIARSTDLTDWVKISDPQNGSGVPGRDSHVVRDDVGDRWLLYSTIGGSQANVSESRDLEHWTSLGLCAELPSLQSGDPRLGGTSRELGQMLNVSESLTVMRHPLNGKWVLLGNWHYVLSDDPTQFAKEDAHLYDLTWEGQVADIGFAGEMVEHDGRWYRSGVLGPRDHWKLGFTEVEWTPDGAFRIVRPSVLSHEAK